MCDSEDDSDWEVGPCPADLKSLLPFSERGLPFPIAGARRSKAPSRAGTGADPWESFNSAALGACRSRQRPMMAPRRQALQCH